MTPFQKHCKNNPSTLLKDTYQLFKTYYPGLEEKAAKLQFIQEVNEIFFRKLR